MTQKYTRHSYCLTSAAGVITVSRNGLALRVPISRKRMYYAPFYPRYRPKF